MSRVDVFRSLTGPAAVRASASVQQVLADLEAALAWAEATEGPEVAKAIREAVAAVMASAKKELGDPLFEAHPELKPAGWATAGGKAAAEAPAGAPLGDGDDPKTDENEALTTA
jgi:hypothetical protein